jgi:serine/threonine protein kinase
MTNPGVPPPPAPSGSLSVGDVVADRYRIDAVLGEGGMGIVYRVQHLHLRKMYAIKVLLPLWSSMPEVVARFEREAVAVGRIQDPHIAVATDFGRLPNGSFFLVMEHVNGPTLREVLTGGPLETLRALHIVRGIVAALHAAHAVGIVHRDMKPENVMLIERDGDPDFAKVLDFGIAKVDGVGAGDQGGAAKVLTQVGAVIGTPEYMAPEQAMGQSVDARSDLYSVGVVLFEMLTGHAPFSGGAVTVLRQHVLSDVPELSTDVAARTDPRISEILRRLLAKLPENRFASTAELMAALDELPKNHEPPERQSVIRPAIDNPRVLVEHVTRRRLAIAGIVSVGAGTMIIVLVMRAGMRATPSIAVAQSTTDSTSSPTTTSAAVPTAPQGALPSSTHEVRPAPAPNYAHYPSQSLAVKPATPPTTFSAAKPPSKVLPGPTPSSTPPDPCTPPYRVDFFGNKVPKPGCP